MIDRSELLTGVSTGELEALADGILAPTAQARLDELLIKHAETMLSGGDRDELDRLLQRVDQLTILKTRASYTLRQAEVGAAVS